MSFICNGTIFIIKFAESMHFIVFPFALIISAVFKVESAMTISHIIVFVALVSSSLLYVFFYKLQLQIFILFVEVSEMGEARTAGEAVCLAHWAGHGRNEGGADNWTTMIHEVSC
jgi:uncharacterized membrane protein YedE/YeeE